MTRSSSDTGRPGLLARWWAAIAPRRQGRGADDSSRHDPVYGNDSPYESGGEQGVAPARPTHTGPPRDRGSREPLGPATPDPGRPAGDTAEAHDEISPHDLPAGHPGRAEAERLAEEAPDGTTRGNR
jgi:hypothetical protein